MVTGKLCMVVCLEGSIPLCGAAEKVLQNGLA